MGLKTLNLPFGHRHAVTLDSTIAHEKLMGQVSNWASRYEPLSARNDFYSRTAVVTVNDLKLTGIACAPMSTDVTASDSVLCVPFVGLDNQSVVNGKRFNFRAGEEALFCPEGRRIGKGGERSVLFAHIEKDRLRRTLAAMGNHEFSVNLDDPTALKLQRAGVSFDQAIRSLCRLVDQFEGQQSLLDMSGIDESFYRVLSMLFCSELLDANASPSSMSTSQHALNRVCDFMMANLHQPLTLTELEKVAGLSARALQLQFLKRFGCSPMAWLREQRLHAVRERLLQNPSLAVAQVATEYCFPSPSRFAAAYKAKFGQLPSETRKIGR